MNIGDRYTVLNLIRSLGGLGRTGVSEKTDYLIIGGTGILMDGRDVK